MRKLKLLEGQEKEDYLAHGMARSKIRKLEKKVKIYQEQIKVLQKIVEETKYAEAKYLRLYRKRTKEYRKRKKEKTEPPEGYPKICKCGGRYEMGHDFWVSRVRCIKCGDYYDL